MSCYMVKKETIDCIVTAIKEDERKGWIVRGMRNNDHDCHDSPWELTDLGKKLWKMNKLNVFRRLKNRSGYGKIKEDYVFSNRVSPSKFQRLKSFQCFLYQCCDSKLIEQTKLYQALEKIKNELLDGIVETLPEYKKAE